MQVDYLKMEILTPVHIGTGEEVDPLGYLMCEEDGDIGCYFVDITTWAGEHPEPETLSTLFENSNMPAVRGYVAENLDPHSYGRRRATVSAPGIFKEYQRKLRDQSTSNQLLISPQLATSLGRPLLPGSSVKGAIRTAVIDHLDRNRNLNLKAATLGRDRREYGQRLDSVLGKITESAFKQLKLSDFEGWSDSTVLVTATEVGRNPKKNSTPKCHAESLPSVVLGNLGHAVLYGKLVMGYGQAKDPQNGRLTLPGGESWGWNELAELVNTYQRKRFEKEQRDFFVQSHFAGARDAVALVGKALDDSAPGQMVLRLGHYAQVEYVTVENNAPLTRKGKDGKQLPWGTTRTLANGRLPFGWVRLTPCSVEEYQQHKDSLKNHGEAVENARLTCRQEIIAQKEQLAEARRQRQREEEEAAAHPWRALLRQLAGVNNWGAFRQLALDGPLTDYRDKENVAEAVRDKALELRGGKWDAERDALVRQWLKAAGLSWDPQADEKGETSGLTDHEQEQVDMIGALSDWGQFRAANISIEALPKSALEVLRDKLRQWGCDNKKAKKDKKGAWKTLQQLLKKG